MNAWVELAMWGVVIVYAYVWGCRDGERVGVARGEAQAARRQREAIEREAAEFDEVCRRFRGGDSMSESRGTEQSIRELRQKFDAIRDFQYPRSIPPDHPDSVPTNNEGTNK